MRYWCAISELLHIPPWEQDRLTVDQFEQACHVIDRMQAEAVKAKARQ